MESSGSSTLSASSSSSSSSSKRLIFDRRYGWICDEWKEPSKEALAGGRGMFCIFPIVKGVVDIASRTFSDAASSTKNVLGKPELLSPDALLASVGNQFQKFTAHSPLKLSSTNGNETSTQSLSNERF